MTIGDLRAQHPAFGRALSEIRRKHAPLFLSVFGTDDVLDDEDNVDPLLLLLLLLTKEMQAVADSYESAQQARTNWRVVGRASRGRMMISYYRNTAGELVSVPEPLAEILAAGRRFDGELVEDPMEPGWLLYQRHGRTEARMPGALIDHLSWRGKRPRDS